MNKTGLQFAVVGELQAATKQLHGSVLVEPLFGGNDFVFVDLGNAADHGAVAQVPANGQGEEAEALALHLVEIAAEVLDAYDAVSEHELVAGLPGAGTANGFQLAELLVVLGLAVDLDVDLPVKLRKVSRAE